MSIDVAPMIISRIARTTRRKTHKLGNRAPEPFVACQPREHIAEAVFDIETRIVIENHIVRTEKLSRAILPQ